MRNFPAQVWQLMAAYAFFNIALANMNSRVIEIIGDKPPLVFLITMYRCIAWAQITLCRNYE
jgi:hypothetical protein